MPYAERASLGLVVAIVFGVFVYVIVTFAVAYGSWPKRGLRRTFGSAFRESVLAVLVTLLLPLYVAIGHKRGKGKRPVVLVHGYTQNRVDFVYLSRFLRARGFGPIYGFNYFSFADIRTSGQSLARFVERVCGETGTTAVDLVCHSMGGLVARACIRLAPTHIRRCVTIASPHSGVRFPGPILGPGGRQLRVGAKFLTELKTTPLGVPMLSIFSTHDNIVAPAEAAASLEALGGRDFVVDQVGHLTILFDKRVATAVADFLDAPADANAAQAPSTALQSGQSASESIDAGTTTGPPLA